MSFSNRGNPSSFNSTPAALQLDAMEDPNRVKIDAATLDAYLKTPQGQASNAARLKSANIRKAGDQAGYVPGNDDLTNVFRDYTNWIQGETDRMKSHEQYVTLAQAQPGRQATILGSSVNQMKSVLGVGGF